MNDSRILEMFFSRDEEAIREVSERYGAYCNRIANRLIGQEEAEECLNDTWLRAWESIPPNRPKNLKLYLARITRNLALNRSAASAALKRSAAMVSALEELEDCLESGDRVENEVEMAELKTAINRFLAKLSERDRGVFLRRYFFVESADEIAARFGLRVNHVDIILFRVRKKLKKYLTEEGYL